MASTHPQPLPFQGGELAIVPAWRKPLAHLAAAWLAILALFRRDTVDMAAIWWNDSNFGHLLFVPPILVWLVWQRRQALAEIAPRAWWPALALVGAGGLAWLLGEAAGVALVRHLALVLMLQGAVVMLLGPHIARALFFPLAYALFLVPFGDFLVQPLQMLTAEMCMALLHLFGVPATMDGVLIRIPNGYFEVAEACAGANFVLAMAAFAVLAAHLCFRSWRRRAAFLVFALAMPVIANGIRAFATIWLAWLTDIDTAAGFDHVVYGWFFFAAVMALVVATAWRFFDRAPGEIAIDPARFAPSAATLKPVLALALVVGLVATPFIWSRVTAARSAAVTHIDLPAVPGWRRTAPAGEPWAPHYAGADLRLMGSYVDASGAQVELAIAAYARQDEGRELVGFGQGAIGPGSRWIWTSAAPGAPHARAERITGPGGVVREVLTFYRVGGQMTGSETRVKLETMKARLLGSDPRAVAVTVSGTDRAAIDRFLRDLGPIEGIL
nr:exosortase A [Sphingomonas gilva]